MKLSIEVAESDLQKYEELTNERTELMKDLHERLSKYKGNPKKAEKDVIYKEASYNFVLKGIEANDIKDRIFKKVFEQWTTKNEKSK